MHLDTPISINRGISEKFKNGMANSLIEWLVTSRLIWICTVCKGICIDFNDKRVKIPELVLTSVVSKVERLNL